MTRRLDPAQAVVRREAQCFDVSACTATTVPLSNIPESWDAEWDALAHSASEPNAFGERWFVRAGACHLAATGTARMIGVWGQNEGARRLIGLLPVEIGQRYARMPIRHVRNWLHFHSFLGTPLIRAGHEQAFWSAILAALDGADWAPGFMHINGLVPDGPVHRGLRAAASLAGRRCDIVHRAERALLESPLDPRAYYEATVRKKKRKEINRLSARLAELGTVSTATLRDAVEIAPWCDAFLALEASGWKGRAGSALGCTPETEHFFREVVAGAFSAGKLDFLRLDLDGRPIAKLVNFMTPPGSFSFKIAFDEEFARFSPGVLLQIENLRVLEHETVRWMDSCAVENHPMINSLWAERRAIVRVTVPLAGWKRRALFHVCRTAERGSAWLRSPRSVPTAAQTDDE